MAQNTIERYDDDEKSLLTPKKLESIQAPSPIKQFLPAATLQQQPHQQQGVVEISPNKRYIRFEGDSPPTSSSIQSSFKAFDTKNGIEIAWHKINLNSLEEFEQTRVAQCINIVKKIHSKYVIEYLDSWFSKESRTLNIITTQLETLREFISKVKTLRYD